MLGAFLFRADDVYKSLDVLSGGEKSRLALLILLLKPLNLLILDEPTNHLDIYAKDILLDALSKWDGTVIFVCHDRAFMEALSTKVLELGGGEHKLFYGNYSYYIEKIFLNCKETLSPVIEKSEIRKTDREAKKETQALHRRLSRKEAELLQLITALESEKIALEAELSKPDVYKNGDAAKKIQKEISEKNIFIEEKTREWEMVGRELEGINGERA
jgi:ATP-binding cassette subfamily F protein 3